MGNQKFCGWTLIILGVVLLAAFGNLSLLAALLPVSLMLAYGTLRMGSNKTKLTQGLRKG
jgi:uncharacterized protein (DUF58 family)